MNLEITLNEHEARLLGVLVEKELTTPESYPLSLNAAITGANQKSNRFPVMDYTEAEVVIGFTGLMAKGLASKLSPAGSGRVEKYKHTAPKTLGLEPPELAVMAELLLRGPQTPGELRTRASRMSPIDSLGKLSEILSGLIERGFVKRLSPAPGSRAERYMQLLAEGLHSEQATAPAASDSPSDGAEAGSSRVSASSLLPRVETLEAEVDGLKTQLQKLTEKLGEDLEEQDGTG